MLTTDPNDPRLKKTDNLGMQEVYLVLSQEERDKGFVRPLRRAYVHKGVRPQYPTRSLTDEERERFGTSWACFEEYPETSHLKGRFWTAEDLNSGCDTVTTMGLALCETYARNPKFYGATYCCGCLEHFPVNQFRWLEDNQEVGS